MSGACLREAELRNAILIKAELDGACLHSANLEDANLRESSLGGANFKAADLMRADLSDAEMGRADLQRANLKGAKVTVEQLSTVATLYEAILDQTLKEKIEEEHPKLLLRPKDEEKEICNKVCGEKKLDRFSDSF